MHNVVKWPNTARFLKYVWPFYNIMDERVNAVQKKAVLWDICAVRYFAGIFKEKLFISQITI